ncbi:hypothetical protein N7541_004828 [Penicillium brevicompactum]|uniref:Uncharacterized protein n=1 Tax=Penicillium brevicompactum TaxID=5074 RepID=A0A9W9UWB1_PENBR|nr:hypothetical protein N7541_004828 [Penicillium brevicompactum]
MGGSSETHISRQSTRRRRLPTPTQAADQVNKVINQLALPTTASLKPATLLFPEYNSSFLQKEIALLMKEINKLDVDTRLANGLAPLLDSTAVQEFLLMYNHWVATWGGLPERRDAIKTQINAIPRVEDQNIFLTKLATIAGQAGQVGFTTESRPPSPLAEVESDAPEAGESDSKEPPMKKAKTEATSANS